jgi:hypothetical protein
MVRAAVAGARAHPAPVLDPPLFVIMHYFFPIQKESE